MARERRAPRGKSPKQPDRPDWLSAHDEDVSYRWARVFWDRAAGYPGAWFDHAKADQVIAHWPRWFKLTDDRFAGTPFVLAPWQAIIVRLLVGWKHPVDDVDPATGGTRVVHVRLFRRLMLWIARKNGKSEFLAALALFFWAYDSVVRAPGFVFARKEKQAFIIFNKMKAMIGYSPELAEAIQPYAKSLYLKTAAALFQVLPGTSDGTHGEGPYVSVWDEMHEARSTTLADNLRQGMGVRLQPMELAASTAGIKSNLVGKGLYDEAVGILEGRVADPTTLVCIFALEPDDDPFDEANWPRANPQIGYLRPFLRVEAGKAQGNPRKEAHFRCYHCNQWVDGVTRWLPLKKWDACVAKPGSWKLYPKTLEGRTCYGGIDVSSTRDITAFILVFPPTEDDPKWRVISRFWCPADTVEERTRADGVPYDQWVAPGKGHNGGPAMETTPDDFVDQNYVGRAIIEARQRYDLRRVGYDPWNAAKLIGDLTEDHDIDPDFFLVMRQGIQTLGEPSRQFERLVFEGAFDHGGQPVLRWMAQNAAIRFDENLNFKPTKQKSAEKIDGIVACVMAVGAANVVESEGSVYEERGLLMV